MTDIEGEARPVSVEPEALTRDAHVCRTCDGLHYHDYVAVEPDGLPLDVLRLTTALFRMHRDEGAAWSWTDCGVEANRIHWFLTHDESGTPSEAKP